MKTEATSKTEKIVTEKEKLFRSGFIVRIVSTVFLLIALIFYCGAGIAFQEIYDKIADRWVDTFGYISLVCSAIILVYCTFEITRSFHLPKQWLWIVAFMIWNLFLFFLPTTSGIFDFLFYQELDWNFAWKWLFIGMIFFDFVIYLIIGFSVKTLGLKKATLFFVGSISIVFALKGFDIFMLSGPHFSEAGQFSYLTVIWLWLICILADTFAYIGGSKWGKTKMAPVISPKKSWEGAYFGVGIAIGIALLMALLLHYLATEYQPFGYSIISLDKEWVEVLILILLSIAFPIISVLGDLLYSLIKRSVDIKDYSNLIPGHGGGLDRLDSFILVHAVAFLLVCFIS